MGKARVERIRNRISLQKTERKRLLTTDHDKIRTGGWVVWCGAGGMFTTRWTKGLVLVGLSRELHYYYTA
jgi:hypothetical protein